MFTWTIVPLGPETRPLHDALVAANGSHVGQCCPDARAALVLDADGSCLGWAKYGTPEEVPTLRHGRGYPEGALPTPDWRISCVFVGRGFRKLGVARAAVEGALDLIAAEGGGVVEAISDPTDDHEVQPRSLPCATVELFERHGFSRVLGVGAHSWVVVRTVEPRDD